MAIDQKEFRNCLGRFATGITVITTVGQGGELVGNTASSFNAVSLDPPLILWSLRRHSYSLKTYLSNDYFAVNVLSAGQEDVSNRFARPDADKWDGVDYRTGETGCPLLPGALAVFECRTVNTYMGGDHVIIVAEVLTARYDPAGTPLLFYAGRYRHVAGS